MKYQITHKSLDHQLDIRPDKNEIEWNEIIRNYEFEPLHNNTWMLRLGKKSYIVTNIQSEQDKVTFAIDGTFYTLPVMDEQQLLLAKLGFKSASAGNKGQLNAPMPGKVLEILVHVGDTVSTGHPVAILEAMKMENELKSPVDGVVTEIAVETGASVEKNTLLVKIEAIG